MDLKNIVFPSFKRRVLAKGLDMGVMLVLCLATTSLGPPTVAFVMGLFDRKWTGYRALIPTGAMLHVLAYFLLADGCKGQSLGKRICGLKVVTLPHGSPCDYWHSIYRNISLRSLSQCFRILDGVLGEEQQPFCNTFVIEAAPVSRTRPSNAPSPPSERATIDLAGIKDYVRQHRRPSPDSSTKVAGD